MFKVHVWIVVYVRMYDFEAMVLLGVVLPLQFAYLAIWIATKLIILYNSNKSYVESNITPDETIPEIVKGNCLVLFCVWFLFALRLHLVDPPIKKSHTEFIILFYQILMIILLS